MPRAIKKQEPEFEPISEPEDDGQYLTDNEEEFEPKAKKQTPKRKYRKRTPKSNQPNKEKKGKKGSKSKKVTKAKKQTQKPVLNKEKTYQSNLLNSATKMKQMLNLNKARLNEVTQNTNNNANNANTTNAPYTPPMRPMNNTLDFSKVKVVPKGILNSILSSKAKKGIKGKKKLTKRVKLPSLLMQKIKEAQKQTKLDSLNAKSKSVLPGYKLGKCPKCGKIHMLPQQVANNIEQSGYESGNELDDNQDLFTQSENDTQEHFRKTGLMYTSTTINGKKKEIGRYFIDNSNNQAIVKGMIKDGNRTEIRVPRK
jgi:hypothetical protein